jgi:hypothetical protein
MIGRLARPGGNVRFGILAKGARAASAGVICLFLGSVALAQPAAPASTGFVRPTATAVRIEPAEAPIIDGDLSDPVWAKAVAIDHFIQKQPNPGAPPTERTVVRILYDENNLYFSVYNYDSQPDAIVVRSMQRDGPLYTADSFVIQLDPGQTRRNAYSFEVGASGGRTDELELNNTQELNQWNTIWAARVRRVADGWTAEVAIPFRDLSYDSSQTEWGFDFSRRIRHKNERIYWSGYNPSLAFTDLSQNGNLTGITGINRGLGLDVQVYGAARLKRDWQNPNDGTSLSITGGANAFYKITPALTGTLTINPDFSDAPLDVRQVNTTRFSLFTPETRDFFLQDAAAFEFGGHNFLRNVNDKSSNNGRPFFSRNIGLVQGLPVSIPLGGKLSGEYGGFGIGALSVITNRTPTTPGQVLSAARITHPIFSESKFGIVFTNGDPSGRTKNSVAGADFQYLDSHFMGNKIVTADAYYDRSFSNVLGDDDSRALAIGYPNEPWGGDFVLKQIGENFQPALGFINRTGIRQYDGSFTHLDRYRGMFLNQLEFDTNYEFVTDLHDRLESRSNDLTARAASTAGDELTFKLINMGENVPARFLLPGRVPVLSRSYDWTNVYARFRSFDGRPLAIDTEITCCSFYDGRSLHTKVALSYRPNAYFEFLPSYEGTSISLPTGHVNVHLLALEAIVNFIPDMSLDVQGQYDNISANFAFLARYRWEYQPGNEIFISYAQGAIITGDSFFAGQIFSAQRSLFSMRLGHTFRF